MLDGCIQPTVDEKLIGGLMEHSTLLTLLDAARLELIHESKSTSQSVAALIF